VVLDLNDLRVLERVAALRSFSAAAVNTQGAGRPSPPGISTASWPRRSSSVRGVPRRSR